MQQRRSSSALKAAQCNLSSPSIGHLWSESIGGLHWPKDVVFGEDDSRLEDEQALLNWSVIRTIVMNILRPNNYQSLKTSMTKLANRVDIIFSLPT